MPDYGVTPDGFVLKRLDTIMDTIYGKLKDGWGFDPTINPQSLLNVLVTSFADEIASLWEVGQDVYYSQYPSSAEGLSLDNAMQFGGVTRLKKARTIYSLKCTGADGTNILYGSLVKSTTQPAKMFQCSRLQTISRSNFRRIRIRPVVGEGTIAELYTIAINNGTYSYEAQEGDNEETILNALSNAITDTDFTKTVAEREIEGVTHFELTIEHIGGQSSNVMVLSDNLIVTECTSNIVFESVDYGEVIVPNNTITEIVTVINGFYSVTNDIAPVRGRLTETDVEARQSYIKRIAVRSKNMLESITSALYDSVQGVTAAMGYENCTSTTDSEGRPPHSIEIVVDGGDDGEVAQVIFSEKANGIQTYGSTTMDVADEFGNIHNISFSRPTYRYVWMKVSLTRNTAEAIPPNYAARTKLAIIEDGKNLNVGQTVFLQKFLTNIYKNVTGVSYISITACTTEIESQIPSAEDYTSDNIVIGQREKAVFDAARIEVNLGGN
jgi:uncharacterized phage protein gp47/JayE